MYSTGTSGFPPTLKVKLLSTARYEILYRDATIIVIRERQSMILLALMSEDDEWSGVSSRGTLFGW